MNNKYTSLKTLNYFKNSNLKEMTQMSPEEYIDNLLMNGAEEQQ